MSTAQSLHHVDTAVHITTRGQGLRSPLLIMPIRPGVERQHRQQVVEAAGVEQSAVAQRAGLGVGIGTACAVCQDMSDHRKQLVGPMGCESRVGTQGAPVLAQGLDVGRVVFLDGVEKALQPLFSHAPWHRRCGDQRHHFLDDAIGRVAKRTAGAVDLVNRRRELFEQQHRALAGQCRIGARHALDLSNRLAQAFDGLARAAPSKRVAPKTGSEGPSIGSRHCGS